MPLADIDVAVLCGGRGTRLAAVLGVTPKVLAPIAGRPYLAWLLLSLKRHNARRIVLCAGHGAAELVPWLCERPADGLDLVLSVEDVQDGTAGALRCARDLLKSDPVMVVNGDTLAAVDLAKFVTAYSTMWLDAVTLYSYEETAVASGFTNAGYYLLAQATLDRLAKSPLTMLDPWLDTVGRGHRMFCEGSFHDIGTPERLAVAAAFFQRTLPQLTGESE